MMSGVYGSNESEEISPFFQFLLQNSSSSASNHGCDTNTTDLFSSTSSIRFSDSCGIFPGESEGVGVSGGVKSFLGSNSEGVDAPPPAPNVAPQRSSKRARAAEFHNLSEKRRRKRINDKLKALQTLIPNSNKTDKASMLDEAIEYLKQLQLQVQMLAIQNGLTLHPGYSLSSLQSMLTSSSPQEFIAESARPNANHLSGDHNVGTSGTLPNFIPSMMTDANSGVIPGFIPSIDNHFWFLDQLRNPKDVCGGDAGSRLRLEISCSGSKSPHPTASSS